MPDAVIVVAVRTPVGRRNGGLSGVHPVDLSAQVLTALADRAGVDPGVVDDVIWGCVSQIGEQSLDIARNAVLAAGWPESVTGVTVDRQCGSSQQAVHFAAATLVAGHCDVVVAGGVESMSRVPILSNVAGSDPFGQAYLDRYGAAPHQGVAAEMIAAEHGFSRGQLDDYSLESHARAARAQDDGVFAEEIVPVRLPDGTAIDTDECVRRDTTASALEALRPAFVEDGRITAGNSSQISDGAAALLMTTSERARQLGLTPLARVHTVALAGANPVHMLTAPMPATRRVLARAGLRLEEIGHFEVNEAFASVPLAWLAELGADPKKLNPHGGAIALGHPLGASGARLMTTLVHQLRAQGHRYGLQTMCEGGGQANATVLERL